MVWHAGNAVDDRDAKGWMLGHFASGPNFSRDVEIKWSDHVAGDSQREWQESHGTSITLLVAGQMTVSFVDGDAVLSEQGDYVIWGPHVPHRWEASKPTVVVTVRWPSGPSRGLGGTAPPTGR